MKIGNDSPVPDDLDRLLDALAREDARIEAPSHLHAAVMRVWDASRGQQAQRPPSTGGWRLAWWSAVTAAAISAMVFSLARRGGPEPLIDAPADQVLRQVTIGGSPAHGEGVLLVADAGFEPTAVTVVRMRMTVSTLAALGMTVASTPDGTTVVEVLMGEDGVARSIRPARVVHHPAVQ